MKRLVKKASMKTFYHGTSAQRLYEILTTGEIGTDKYADQGGNEDVVFLAGDANMALHYAGNAAYSSSNKSFPDWPVVLEIQADTENLGPDLDDWNGTELGNENPTWEETLNELGQVEHRGKISASQIVKITNEYNDILNLNDCVLFENINQDQALKKISSMFSKTCSIDEFEYDWFRLEEEIED